MDLKYFFVLIVSMSGRRKELWDQGCFIVKENTLYITVYLIPLNAHEKVISFTAVATLKCCDYLSFHLCYTLQMYEGAKGMVEIGS